MRVKSFHAHAFTLVELLVVIGIIALLISILLPVVNRARAHAASAQCLSNLRSLGEAEMIYAANFKGFYIYTSCRYPDNQIFWDRGTNPVTGCMVDPAFAILSGYGTVPNVFVCPGAVANGRTINGDSPLVQTGPSSYIFGRCYGWNGNLSSLVTTTGQSGMVTYTSFGGCRATQIQNASDTVFMADIDNMRTNNRVTLVNDALPPSSGNSATSGVVANLPTFPGYHLGRGGVLWADGHASLERPQYMAPGTTTTALVTGTIYTAEQCKAAHIGFLARSQSDLNSGMPNVMDYYFLYGNK